MPCSAFEEVLGENWWVVPFRCYRSKYEELTEERREALNSRKSQLEQELRRIGENGEAFSAEEIDRLERDLEGSLHFIAVASLQAGDGTARPVLASYEEVSCCFCLKVYVRKRMSTGLYEW